ncbi:uncharacterized protein PHACADRAFT_260852 [Phanerochaete carnosa HHB-10118-sp]|uniref:Uncharacterized protein n=1 Tax=Phanerochaete carnosa (strain HHB-10118-sp) TaxID=650164 RepID=K5VLZ5_PHACS|nr:uncharacterized protein PHACADRAFT_260852 [Phanerochaete carnosa HHB-10118-sp]EKM52453.1 hypothetical protein PHACADRAFT_260852 [Phanerochaete carnosa HHB-10118-sp]
MTSVRREDELAFSSDERTARLAASIAFLTGSELFIAGVIHLDDVTCPAHLGLWWQTGRRSSFH